MDSNKYKVFLPGIAHATTFALLGYPLDTIKTRIQSDYKNKSSVKCVKCVKDIFRANGIFGFYRGVSSIVASQILKTPIQFPIFEYLKKEHKMNSFIAGAISTAVLTPISTPLEVIKVNSQASNKTEYKNTVDFVRKYYHKKGINGFYKGFQITLIKDVVFGATFLGTYSLLNNKFANKNKDVDILSTFACGSLSHIICWLSFMPIDYVKTTIQRNDQKAIIKTVVDIVRKDGVKRLWSGVVPVTLRTFPVSGVGMVSYELVRNYVSD